MSIGHFIGRRAADVVHYFRGRQVAPCTVEWDQMEFYPIGEPMDAPKLADEPCCGMCDNGCWDE